MNLLYTAHVPAGDGPFPTVLALHGWGASGHDLLGLAPLIESGQALVICPQGPVTVPIQPGYEGYGWFPITMGEPPDMAAFAKAASQLEEFLEAALERYPIQRDKLVVMGFSQGGVMAYDLVLRDPGRFAALVALSSWFPEELVARAPKLPGHAGFPVLIQHGTADPMIPVDRARESRDNLTPYGVQLAYQEYEMEHSIGPEALRELVRWLHEKVLNPIQLA